MNTLHHYNPDDPYPESDGLPMAENTQQYDWLVKIKENLEILFADQEDVFIAGDLFWYPLPDRKLTYPIAPDVMVVFGRPKGRRGSYRQWEEDGIAPQVVFEILSPSNTALEMINKRNFYDQYGVQEYYVYNPDNNKLEIWTRQNSQLNKTKHVHGWISPLLKIRFAIKDNTMQIFYPSGKPFLNSVELNQYAEEAAHRADIAEQRAENAEQRAENQERQAETAKQQMKIAKQLATEAEQRAQAERKEKELALAELAQLRTLLIQAKN